MTRMLSTKTYIRFIAMWVVHVFVRRHRSFVEDILQVTLVQIKVLQHDRIFSKFW